MANQQYNFDVEINKILKLMINSLYTNRDVALRELISNAADACDKLRYLAAQNSNIISDELKISIATDKDKKYLIITDNGIGMNKQDLIENLGTIAKSGTENFLKNLSGDNAKDLQLIGQFGVGFYSSFMIANEVIVYTNKYDNDECLKWVSKGEGVFEIEEVAKEDEGYINRGTKIILALKDDATSDFLDKFHIKHVVQTYSDHINIKVEFVDEEGKSEILNSSSALWKRSKNEISEDQYNEFYKNISHLPGNPYHTIHTNAEGIINYNSLLFVPSSKPFDLFHPDRKTSVKLYVKKVFISEDLNLVPAYLRFIRGLIDSDDLALNISRETLQYNPILEKIKKNTIKKILSELKKKSEESEEEYIKFWNNFGAVLKEGLCESTEFREEILEICRFHTSKSGEKLVSISEYLARMKDGQDKIYFLSAENIEKARASVQLEIFLKKDIEVIFLTDAVDDFWVTVAIPYKDKEFISVTRENIDLGETSDVEEKEDEKKSEDNDQSLINFFKEILGAKVKDVKISKKLTDSPVCLTVDAMSMDIRMERFLLEQKQIPKGSTKILEINANNLIVKSIKENIDGNKNLAEEKVKTLFDLACILEEEPIADIKDFSVRLQKLL